MSMIPLPPGVNCQRTANGNVIGYKWLAVTQDGGRYSPVAGGDEWNTARPQSLIKPTETNSAGFYFTYSPNSRELRKQARRGRRKYEIEFVYQDYGDIVFHEWGGRAWKVASIHGALASGWLENMVDEHDWILYALTILVMIVTFIIALPFVLRFW